MNNEILIRILNTNEYVALAYNSLNDSIVANDTNVWNQCLIFNGNDKMNVDVNTFNYYQSERDAHPEIASNTKNGTNKFVMSFNMANNDITIAYTPYLINVTYQNCNSYEVYDGYWRISNNCFRPVFQYVDNDKSNNLYY